MKFNSFRKYILALAILSFLTFFAYNCGSNAKANYFNANINSRFAFKGEKIFDGASRTNVEGKDKKVVIIVNLPYHFALGLPYSEKWKFIYTKKSNVKFRGNAGPINLTINVIKTNMSVKKYLSDYKSRLSSAKIPGLIYLKIYETKYGQVMRSVIDMSKLSGGKKLKEVYHFNYFSAKRWKNQLYTIHLSKVVRNVKRFNEAQYKLFVTRLFMVKEFK